MSAPPLRLALPAVMLGGAMGALARHGVDVLVQPTGIPWGTLGINLLGSALLALLPALAVVRRRPVLAVGLGAGVLGGFTTMSAFADQTRELLATGHVAAAATYVALSVGGSLLAVLVVDHLSTPASRREVADEGGDL
ncbi:hypothetical protein GCM10027425_03810 [Alteromonas gracilis]